MYKILLLWLSGLNFCFVLFLVGEGGSKVMCTLVIHPCKGKSTDRVKAHSFQDARFSDIL